MYAQHLTLVGTGDTADTFTHDNGGDAGAAYYHHFMSSAALLVGPFDLGWCTAFSATGGSLQHCDQIYSSDST